MISKLIKQYITEEGNWVDGITPAQKLEFYSTGATLSNPVPKWDTVITKFPTDWTPFLKPNGKNWDWDKIRYEYSKHNPKVSMEQVKAHKTKLRVTAANLIYIAEVKELEDYPKDFAIAVNKGKWDYELIAEMYKPFGVARDMAIAHFRTLNVTTHKPTVGLGYLVYPASAIAAKLTGQVNMPKTSFRSVEVLAMPRTKPNSLVKYLAKHNDPVEVFWASYETFKIPFDILE